MKPWIVPILARTPAVRAIRATRGTGARIRWGGLFAQKALRMNGKAYWPVHFTSVVICRTRIRVGVGTAPGLSPNRYIQGNNGIEIGDHTLVAAGAVVTSSFPEGRCVLGGVLARPAHVLYS